MKARLIINPISGTRSKNGLAETVESMLAPAGWETETCYTRCQGDATTLSSEAAAKGYDLVIAAGGDGTINETATGLCGTDTALGLIPCGSGNGLARHLNIPVDVHEALKIILAEQPHPIDYATIESAGRRLKFFCTFGVGFDAEVGAAFARQPKRGFATYLKSTFRTYSTYEPEEYEITANGEVFNERAFLVAVCNASQYGNNAYIAPGAVIDDGLLDVTVIHADSTLSTAHIGFDLLTGNLEKNVHIRSLRAQSVSIRRKRAGVAHADGEPIELSEQIDITCHPSAIKVYAPAHIDLIKPFVTPAKAMMSDARIAFHRLFRRTVK